MRWTPTTLYARAARGFVLLLTVMSLTGACGQTAFAQPTPQASEAEELNRKLLALAREGKNAEALPLAERVLELREKELGREHPSVADALSNVAAIKQRLQNFSEAEKLYRRALSIYEKGGDAHIKETIQVLDSLGLIEGDARQALSLHERGLALKEKAYGADSLQVSTSLFSVGHLSDLLGDRDKAERSFRRFLAIREKAGGGADGNVGAAYLRLGCVLRKMGKGKDAEEVGAQAKKLFSDMADKRGDLSQEDIINGKAISKPQPSYPDEAKRARAQGTVRVQILVGESGSVLAACAEEDGKHPSLMLASELAAYGARFTPTTVKGKPVKVSGVITYRFVLFPQ